MKPELEEKKEMLSSIGMQGGNVGNEKTNGGAAKVFHSFVRSFNEIESKEEIDDDDILKLTTLLSNYAKHPDSTEERRINASKELDRIHAMYLSKNKS